MIPELLQGLKDLLSFRKNAIKEQRERADNALRAVCTALNETEIYYQKYGRTNRRDFETEEQLSRYWAAAAIPLRHIDRYFSMICEHKSAYWVDPEKWTDQDVLDFKIDLRNVRLQYNRLLWGPRRSNVAVQRGNFVKRTRRVPPI
jgi:hypothetical protein